MFRNYFLIYYRRHKYFCHIYVFLAKIISVYILNHLGHGRNESNSLFLRNRNISCNKQQASKWIDLYFGCKRRTRRWSNRGTSHFVLCETKPKNLSMLCMKICLYCVWQFIYVVYETFWLLFLSILCMTLSMTSNVSILYNKFNIIQWIKMSLLTGMYGHVGHHILH